ncbi:MAG: TIGR00725 family protein [Candidatus Aminicenantes bacterium]|nr:TIGR00725 family protein [Candidatus Aminicenantes bacterium]
MNDIRARKRLAVIGGGRPGRKALEEAREVGRLIARAGAALVCGGLGGVMEAAALGAHEEGGLTIGILPGNDPSDANPSIDVPVATGLGYTRNSLVVMNADAVVAVDGEYGTLSEIAYALIYGKRVVGLGTWEIRGVMAAESPDEAVRLALDQPEPP